MFEYVFVLASVILGLAITHLLQGVVAIIQHPDRKPLYWIHLVWVAFLFLTTVFWWWWEFRLQQVQVWTFQVYVFVLLYAALIYLCCALVLPRDMEGYDSYKDYFFARRGWFFGLAALAQPMDVVDTWLKGPDYAANLGVEYYAAKAVIVAACLVGVFWRNERDHAVFAVLSLVYQLSLVLRLYETVA